MKEQRYNICLTKSELSSTAITGVYTFGLNIPDFSLHKKFKLYVKEFIVITPAGVNHNMFQLKSNTIRFINNWSSKGMTSTAPNYNNQNLLNNGDILISVISEVPYYISSGSFDDSLDIINPFGKHQIWVEDHSTNAPVDTHDWYVNLVIIGYD